MVHPGDGDGFTRYTEEPNQPGRFPLSTSQPLSRRQSSRTIIAEASSDDDSGGLVPSAAVSSLSFDLDENYAPQILGPADHNLRVVERSVDADVHVRGARVTVTGGSAECRAVRRIFLELQSMARRGHPVSADAVFTTMSLVRRDTETMPSEGAAIVTHRGRGVHPKTPGQRDYVDAIDTNTIVFGVGPAGSGKTYLAMAKAVQALQRREVHRIILTRPAVEAGENLGFLPGTLHDKIDPYLRPLHDALRDMVEPETIPKLMESGIIEVAPLAYMRGRTLNNAFVILDEAQNTTPAQMKMFLTRLGFGTTMVVTGDLTQVDLPNQQSGLARAVTVLDEVNDITIVRMESEDVVRHHLVSAIVDAYEHSEGARPSGADGGAGDGRGGAPGEKNDRRHRQQRRRYVWKDSE
ncbi:PhoH family protein [Corynebacterium kroppenstedtii]